ncbi:hypothetical protein RQP46_002684 [Phenoliferia psychrophenolica]
MSDANVTITIHLVANKQRVPSLTATFTFARSETFAAVFPAYREHIGLSDSPQDNILRFLIPEDGMMVAEWQTLESQLSATQGELVLEAYEHVMVNGPVRTEATIRLFGTPSY